MADWAVAGRRNREVERYNQILAEDLLHSCVWRPTPEPAAAIEIRNVRYDCRRCHVAASDKPLSPA